MLNSLCIRIKNVKRKLHVVKPMKMEKQSLKDLTVGETYFIKETKAPQGYRIPVNLDGSDKIYEISVASNPMENIFTCQIDQKIYQLEDSKKHYIRNKSGANCNN